MIQFSDQDQYCKGKHNTQSKKKIEYICFNQECSQDPFCCKKCEKELHDSHRKDCVDLEEFDQRFQKMHQTQTALKQQLANLIISISSKFQAQIKQLEFNMTSIEQLMQEKKLGGLQEKIFLIKYLNSLESVEQNNAGFQINQRLTQFDKYAQELDDFLTDQLKPAIKYEKRSLELMRDKKWNDALQILEKAFTFDDKHFKLYAWKAKALRNQKEFVKAQKVLEKGLKNTDKDADLFREQGNLLIVQNKCEEANEYFSKSLQIDPDNLESQTQKGYCLLGMNKFLEAEAQFQKIIKNKQKDKLFYYSSLLGCGQALTMQNKYIDAEEQFQKALEIEDRSETRVLFGKFLEKKNEKVIMNIIDTILGEYDQAVKLDPTNLEALIAKAKLLKKQRGTDKLILEIVEKINGKDPENPSALTLKGYALWQQSQFNEAQQCYMRVIKNNDLEAQLRVEAINQQIQLWNRLQINLNEIDQQYTLNLINCISEINQKTNIKFNKVPLEDFGFNLFKLKRFNEASEVFKEVIKQFTCSYDIWNLYCRSLFQSQRYQEALKVFDEIIEKNIYMCSYVICIQGDILFELNQLDKAQQAYEIMKKYNLKQQRLGQNQDETDMFFNKLMFLAPTSEVAPIKYCEKIGNILLQQNQYHEALVFFRKYIKEIEAYQKNKRITPQENEFEFLTFGFTYLNALQANINIIKTLLKLNEFQEAFEIIGKIQNLVIRYNRELEAEFHFLKSEVLAGLNKIEEAKTSLEQAQTMGYVQKEQNRNARNEMLVEKAQSLIKENKLDEARISFVEALKANTKLFDSYFIQCEILLEHNDLDQLLKWIEEAIKIDPRIEKIHKIQSIFSKRMSELIAFKKYENAIVLLNMADQQQNEIGITEMLKSNDWYFQIGLGLLQNADYSQAKDAFDKFINSYEQKKDKIYVNACYLKCLTLYKSKGYEQALKDIEELEKIPDIKRLPQQIQILKGDSLFKLMEYTEAFKVYRTAQKQKSDPKRYFYHINMGDSLFQGKKSQNDFEEAIEEYNKAYKEGSKQKDQECINIVLLHKGYALYSQGLFQEAEISFNELLKYEPKNAQAFYYLSKTLENQNKVDDAIKVLEQAQKMELPINDETRPNLIDIFSLRSENVKDIQLPFL